MGCDRIWKYGDYDIVTDVDEMNASTSSSRKNRRKGPRSRRSLEDEYELEESLVEAPVIKVENITDSNLELVSDNPKKAILDEEKFFFNKTTDMVISFDSLKSCIDTLCITSFTHRNGCSGPVRLSPS